MSRLKFGLASIVGLAAALLARPEVLQVQAMIDAARLSPAAKYVVQTMEDFAALAGTRPGDFVTVVVGDSGGREVREVVAVYENGLIGDSVVVERDRDVSRPVTESIEVGQNGALELGYVPANGLDSIANFGNVLFTDPDTGESALYAVVDDGTGAFAVAPELAGKTVKIQYTHTQVLAAASNAMHQG